MIKTAQILMLCTPEYKKKVKNAAKKRGLLNGAGEGNQSELIREALHPYLDNYEDVVVKEFNEDGACGVFIREFGSEKSAILCFRADFTNGRQSKFDCASLLGKTISVEFVQDNVAIFKEIKNH